MSGNNASREKSSPDVYQDGSDGSSTNAATAGAAVKAVKAGNAKDVDIAAQIIAQYTEEGDRSWTEEEEKKLIRKVDWMLVPIVGDTAANPVMFTVANTPKLFVCATLSGLDKTAISAAAIYGLKQDLKLTGAQYSWLGSAPFFGGLVFMGPSAYLIQR